MTAPFDIPLPCTPADPCSICRWRAAYVRRLADQVDQKMLALLPFGYGVDR